MSITTLPAPCAANGCPRAHFNPARVLDEPNLLAEFAPQAGTLGEVLHVADAGGLTLYADIVTQQLLIQ